MTVRNDSSIVAAAILVAAAVITALAIFAVPHASAAPTGSVVGFSEDATTFGTMTSCQNSFTGDVVADDGHGNIVASIEAIRFGFCQDGTSVTANGLPWTLNLDVDSSYVIDRVDVDIHTPQGVCRYAGQAHGVMQFPNGVYDLRGEVTRQSSGCGGPQHLALSNLVEVIGIRG
jgi:hypothetical protein